MSSREDDRFQLEIPPGDNRLRRVCRDCGWIDYVNPKVVVGAVCIGGDGRQFLLCRRAIEPRQGFWTIPAGFLEEKESPEAGARREAKEEACVELEIDALLGLYSIARISQIQLIYRARLVTEHYACGEESLDVRLFNWEEIPWQELAFPTVRLALKHFREVEGQSEFQPRVETL